MSVLQVILMELSVHDHSSDQNETLQSCSARDFLSIGIKHDRNRVRDRVSLGGTCGRGQKYPAAHEFNALDGSNILVS